MPDEAPLASKHEGPVVRVTSGRDGHPVRATARGRIERPVSRVWSTIYDIERFARFLPMVNRARRRGDSVALDLGFRVAFFTAGFEFTTNMTCEEEKWLTLAWTSGEPRDVKLGFALTPDGADACFVETEASFDVQSLGWLVKFFLKHHPEIQHGIFPGITLVLLDSIRRATSE